VLKYDQESLDLRSTSYNLVLNSSKGEKVVAKKKLQVRSRSSEEGTWKGINTHKEPIFSLFNLAIS
jgi:hypothetical protein